MAAQPRAGFQPGELADEAEVEQLETQVQPEAAPEAQPEPQQPEPPHEAAVDYGRFKEVVDRKEALEKELTDAREYRARMDERQRLIGEANDRAQREQEARRRAAERPDPSTDPIGAELYDLRGARAQQEQMINQLQTQLNNFGQNYLQGQEELQFQNWTTSQANQYAQSDANYFPSVQHVYKATTDFWREVAPNAPAGMAEKLVEGTAVLIGRLSQQYGGNFPAALAKLAKTWGFIPAAANGNGVRAPQRVAATPQQQRLAQVANGQRRQGLGGVPAGSNNGGATAYRNYGPADIDRMSEAEFMAALADPVKARDLKYAMGRAEGLDDGEANY